MRREGSAAQIFKRDPVPLGAGMKKSLELQSFPAVSADNCGGVKGKVKRVTGFGDDRFDRLPDFRCPGRGFCYADKAVVALDGNTAEGVSENMNSVVVQTDTASLIKKRSQCGINGSLRKFKNGIGKFSQTAGRLGGNFGTKDLSAAEIQCSAAEN